MVHLRRGLHLLVEDRNLFLFFFFVQPQIGSYYGSEVCGLDVDQDGITDLLLVAAPMYLGSGNKEAGRVYIYSFTGVSSRGVYSPPEGVTTRICFLFNS